MKRLLMALAMACIATGIFGAPSIAEADTYCWWSTSCSGSSVRCYSTTTIPSPIVTHVRTYRIVSLPAKCSFTIVDTERKFSNVDWNGHGCFEDRYGNDWVQISGGYLYKGGSTVRGSWMKKNGRSYFLIRGTNIIFRRK